ncbi:MAG: hypothetical protein ACOCRK_06895 [bacterium]
MNRSWEANYARILKYNKIEFEYEPKQFNFTFKKNNYSYIPDFKVDDKWFEVKGWLTKSDLETIYAFKQTYKNEELEVIESIKYFELYELYKDKIKLETTTVTPQIKTKVVGITFWK